MAGKGKDERRRGRGGEAETGGKERRGRWGGEAGKEGGDRGQAEGEGGSAVRLREAAPYSRRSARSCLPSQPLHSFTNVSWTTQ